MCVGDGRHLNYHYSQASKIGIKEYVESKINRELLETLILTCTKEMASLLPADLERRKKQWSESRRLAKEADKKVEDVDETENNLTDITALQSFGKKTLSKVIESVYVYGADRVEAIWKIDDIFSEEMPEKRKVIDSAEMLLMDETPAEA